MIRSSFIFIGIFLIGLAVFLLKNGNFPTSGLMVLTVGILITLVASLIKFKKSNNSN